MLLDGAILCLKAELEAMAEETKPAEGSQPKEQVVDPWHVEAAEGEDKIDYDKLISKCQLIAFIRHRLVIFLRHAVISCQCNLVSNAEQFGSQRITPEILERIEKVTGKKVHHFLKREVFFSHR